MFLYDELFLIISCFVDGSCILMKPIVFFTVLEGGYGEQNIIMGLPFDHPRSYLNLSHFAIKKDVDITFTISIVICAF